MNVLPFIKLDPMWSSSLSRPKEPKQTLPASRAGSLLGMFRFDQWPRSSRELASPPTIEIWLTQLILNGWLSLMERETLRRVHRIKVSISPLSRHGVESWRGKEAKFEFHQVRMVERGERKKLANYNEIAIKEGKLVCYCFMYRICARESWRVLPHEKNVKSFKSFRFSLLLSSACGMSASGGGGGAVSCPEISSWWIWN